MQPHHAHPPTPPAALHATLDLEWPGPFQPLLEATPENTAHDFLVAVPRPDLLPNRSRRRSAAVYTVDLP